MFWSNIFVWDGSGGDFETRVSKVYEPTLNLLRTFRMRQASVAVRSEVLRELVERKAKKVLTIFRDLGVLHQIEAVLVQKTDLPPQALEEDLRQEMDTVRGILGEDVIMRGNYAFAERNPFELVDTYRRLGLRWVVLDSRAVLGPYVDLLDDTIYELNKAGSVYAYFPDPSATRLLREAEDPTARQFKEHFPSKRNRKCYLVTVLNESDLLRNGGHVWELLDDLYADPTVRSWRVSTLEELFQKRRLLEPELLPRF